MTADPDLEIVRGDKSVLLISDLTARGGTPTTFADGDILRFTVKRYHSQEDDDALIALASDGGGVEYDIGAATATITILPEHFDGDLEHLATDLDAVWDLQHELVDDPDDIATLRSGTIRIAADVTLAPEEGS